MFAVVFRLRRQVLNAIGLLFGRSVHEGTKEFAAKCTECGKTFNDRGYLSSHMKIHRDKKRVRLPTLPQEVQSEGCL
ncbi:hypothetical protein NQ317_016283 [Molorchus minor]|uniref:C2H2-type domain-containing protein n=1 Tax=Molorchus minor TaxID=1323400 RepID=A0ABQ9IWK8_9CUCU|nr:hypothetical protein NQ317_016283 [Molorchus minor]